MTLLEKQSLEADDHTEVLFREAKRRRRRRWFIAGLITGFLLVVFGISVEYGWGRGSGPPTTSIRLPAPPVVANAAPICTVHSGFELSLAHDYGGQSSPVAAAQWFAKHGGVPNVPTTGWHETNRNGQGAIVYSGENRLSIVQGSDGTWQADGGLLCT